MSSKRIPPEGSPRHPGSTTLPVFVPIYPPIPDHQMRRRAVSCSTLSDGTAGSQGRHAPSAGVYFPTSPYPLTHVLVHSSIPSASTLDSFEQAGSTGHVINTETLSIGSRGITQDQTAEFSSPTSLNPGAMWPGTAVGYSHGGICQGYQGFQDPSTSLAPPNDPSRAPVSQSGYSMGLMLTVTQPPCDGPTPTDQTLSEDYDSRSGMLHSLARSGQCTSPSAVYWLGDQADPTLLYAPGSRTPSSRSTLSSPSASPFSKFSQLSLNSPPSSIGAMDDDGGYLQPECQTRGEPRGAVNGWGSEQSSTSITSPLCYDNIPGLLAGNPFLPVQPLTPTSTITDACALPNDIGTTGAPEPSRQSQSFQVESSYARMGEHPGVVGKLSTDLQPSPSSQFLPPPSSSEDQQSAVLGFPSHFYSGLSGTSEMAGASLATQINKSYEAIPFAYDPSTLPAIDRGIYSPSTVEVAGRGACLNHHSRIGGPSTGKTGGWSDKASRAKKVATASRNQLLHISIESLEQSGRIPRMSSLRDTMRAIIINCFDGSPTRQDIVDLLFRALPEITRRQVVELEVKKYLKDRIGHILSAPANKSMFVNISGTGRWTIGEGFD